MEMSLERGVGVCQVKEKKEEESPFQVKISLSKDLGINSFPCGGNFKKLSMPRANGDGECERKKGKTRNVKNQAMAGSSKRQVKGQI